MKNLIKSGLKGKFAIVNHWPEALNNERELVDRFKIAASKLGLKCIELDAHGFEVGTGKKLTNDDVDFACNLHYATPKCYDIYSMLWLALPIYPYHERDYAHSTQNALTHDDFLGTGSSVLEDHIARGIESDPLHLPTALSLYPSVAEPILKPESKERRLFYIGTNWEKQRGSIVRNVSLLQELDAQGVISIYGPKKIGDLVPWEGYQGYIGELPFDGGASVVKENASLGAALILSQPEQIESQFMASRFYEALAAGAVVICNEHPFARKRFGDSVLYFDPEEEGGVGQILSHLQWMNENPDAATEMARKAQQIYLEEFTPEVALQKLYESIAARRQDLSFGVDPKSADNPVVKLVCVLNAETGPDVDLWVESCRVQDYGNIHLTLVVDAMLSSGQRKELLARFRDCASKVDLVPVERLKHLYPDRFGKILAEVLAGLRHEDDFEYLVISNLGEEMFSNHISSLVRMLQGSPALEVGATREVYKVEKSEGGYAYAHPGEWCFSQSVSRKPIGLSKFVFRRSVLDDRLFILLPYLHRKSLMALVGDREVVQSNLATCILDRQSSFVTAAYNELKDDTFIRSLYRHLPQWEQTAATQADMLENLAHQVQSLARQVQNLEPQLQSLARQVQNLEPQLQEMFGRMAILDKLRRRVKWIGKTMGVLLLATTAICLTALAIALIFT